MKVIMMKMMHLYPWTQKVTMKLKMKLMSALLAGFGHSPFRSADFSSVPSDLAARTGTKRPSSTPQPWRKKHCSACLIGGCGHTSPKLRWHIYHHLPNFLCKIFLSGILNYCDPEFFSRPTFEEEVLKKRGPNWKVAVGIHPKRAANYTPDQWDCFLKLLSNPRVTAISEIGFDFTVSNSLWLYQEELFDKILSLGTLGRVLIMHLRGSADDRCSWVSNRQALRHLRKACFVHQRIHLHTFSGDAGMVHAWLKAFPHCYFGVLGLVHSFNPDQLQAVRGIPLNRLLLETDAPHFKLHYAAITLHSIL